jgi:hypothetical protein
MQAGIGKLEFQVHGMGRGRGFQHPGRAETGHQQDFLMTKSALNQTQSISHLKGFYTKF